MLGPVSIRYNLAVYFMFQSIQRLKGTVEKHPHNAGKRHGLGIYTWSSVGDSYSGNHSTRNPTAVERIWHT